MCRSYYRGSNAIVFVYDVTNLNSLENIGFWMNELEASCQMDGMPWNTTLTGETPDPA
jgi:GTPase SAR1 family protein